MISDLKATMIAEGVDEPTGREHYLAAWQHLVNTGLAWSLQGWFGRMATRLIERGHIHSKQEETET